MSRLLFAMLFAFGTVTFVTGCEKKAETPDTPAVPDVETPDVPDVETPATPEVPATE